jgi:hypothetical protein
VRPSARASDGRRSPPRLRVEQIRPDADIFPAIRNIANALSHGTADARRRGCSRAVGAPILRLHSEMTPGTGMT